MQYLGSLMAFVFLMGLLAIGVLFIGRDAAACQNAGGHYVFRLQVCFKTDAIIDPE